ncbi:MAG: hypothetical protein ACLUVM_09965 [Blautia faecis]
MSSNSFIERNILDTKRLCRFLPHSNSGLVYGDGPSFPAADPCRATDLMVQIVPIYAVVLVLALIFANVPGSYPLPGRLSSVIRQMQTVRHGPPVSYGKSTGTR